MRAIGSVVPEVTMTVETLSCIQCDREFDFSPEDRQRYAQRGFDLPRRCPGCRRHKAREACDDFERRREVKKRDYRLKYDS
jgi:hypothetical protein